MKVNSDSMSIYVGGDDRTARANQMQNKEEERQFNGKSIKAKDLRMVPDTILEKKLMAQKKAWKLITDANQGEGDIDDLVSGMQKKIEDLRQASHNTLQEINQIHENIAGLQKEYHVSDDSQEQKDLELLMKQQEKMQGSTEVSFTDEERERLVNMGELTDYQIRALGYHESLHTKNRELEQMNNEIKGNQEGITAITIERGKSHNMVDAKAESDKIMEAAAKEAVNGLLEEGKDKVDEKIDKKKEEAEKKADEKKAEEEKEEKAQEAKEMQEAKQSQSTQATTSAQNNNGSSSNTDAQPIDVSLATDAVNVQQKITNVLKEDKLLSEDLKGIAVDTNL